MKTAEQWATELDGLTFSEIGASSAAIANMFQAAMDKAAAEMRERCAVTAENAHGSYGAYKGAPGYTPQEAIRALPLHTKKEGE